MDSVESRNSQPFQEIVFENHLEFMSFLDLRNDRWEGGIETTWVFRGQSDASWDLLPSAWRPSFNTTIGHLREQIEQYIETYSPLHFTSYFGTGKNVRECLIQVATELEAIYHFAKISDEVGLPSESTWPGKTQLKRFFRAPPVVINYGWSFYPGEPSLIDCLAQHHGIPTRLLDCTRNPKIAAFFAAEDTINNDKNTDLAVWAIRLDSLHRFILQPVTCRRSDHSFLHAQEGLFLWSPIGDLAFVSRGEWPSFDKLILAPQDTEEIDKLHFFVPMNDLTAFHAISKRLVTHSPVLKKVTLTSDAVPSLLRCLLRERVSKAILMPTYDHIRESLQLHWQLGG